MSRWFRVYDDAINDPKILRLSESNRWHWIAVLAIASKNDGALPSIDDVALMLRKSKQATIAILKTLKDAGLLDEVDGGLAPHNWNGRQFKSDVSNERVKRYRQRQRNVTSTVTETPPETDTESEQKTDAPAAVAAPSVSPDPPTDEAELYRRSKTVLGPSSGGMVKKLITAKGGSIPLARAAIEQAATKHDAREYIGAIIRGRGDSPEDLRARGEAW